jgi:hypothetical protein
MEQISFEVAEQVCKSIAALYDFELWGTPTLYDPGFHCSGWAVVWEEGPEEWISRVSDSVQVPGVLIEPVNHWCLGLYRTN